MITYHLFKEFDSVLWQQQWITLWVFFIQLYICLFNNQWIFMKNLNENRIKALTRIENGELSSRSSESMVPGGWRVAIHIIENKVHHMLEGGGEGGDGSGCECGCVCAHALWRALHIFSDYLGWVSLNKWEKCSLQIFRETIIHVKGWESVKTLDIEPHICKKNGQRCTVMHWKLRSIRGWDEGIWKNCISISSLVLTLNTVRNHGSMLSRGRNGHCLA